MLGRVRAEEHILHGWVGSQDCDAVFNLELPTDAPTYAHRAGRTGRFGRPGLVITLVEASEVNTQDSRTFQGGRRGKLMSYHCAKEHKPIHKGRETISIESRPNIYRYTG